MAEQKLLYKNKKNQLKKPGNKDKQKSEIKIKINSLSNELSIAQLDLEEAKQVVDKFTIKK